MNNYPHRCPECDSSAYVGLNSVDCINAECKHAGPGAREKRPAPASGALPISQCAAGHRFVALTPHAACPVCASATPAQATTKTTIVGGTTWFHVICAVGHPFLSLTPPPNLCPVCPPVLP
jgi:rubrerythrin